MRAFFTLLILLLFPCYGIAQVGITAVPFLQVSPGPSANISAGTYTALPTNDPAGFYYNPAQLGNFAYDRNFSYQLYPNRIDWLSGFNDDITFNSSVFSIGYNFKNIQQNLPISVGFGYMNTVLDLGKQVRTNEQGLTMGTYHSEESYDLYSIGVKFDYKVRVNIGYAVKSIRSNLAGSTVTPKAHDVGLQLSYPFESANYSGRFSLGYALQNIGDFVAYGGAMADPLPRTAALGYAVTAGYNRFLLNEKVKFVNAHWSLEASDILAEIDEDGRPNYIHSPGDISVFQNVLLGKSDSQVTVNQGWRVHLLETLQVGRGRFVGPGYPQPIKTTGFSLSTGFLLKLISSEFKIPSLTQLSDHLEFTFSWSRYAPLNENHPLDGTTFKGLTIGFFGF